MGRIANKHLAKLWDFMANYNSKSAGATAGDIVIDILEAFLECDEALSELQDERDHWKTMYGNACGDQDVLKESIRLLDTENRRLKKEIEQRRKEADGLYKALDLLRDEKECLKQKVRDQEKEYESLQGLNRDIITKHNEDMRQLREKNEELKSRLNSIYGTELPDVKEEYTMTFAIYRENFDKLMAVIKEGMDNVMRDSLKAFCDDHDSCRLCPLKECGSDLGSDFDSMSDEEIEKYYKIAINTQSETEKPDLTFGDIVKAPWSDDDYIFIETLTSSVRLYNIPKKRFVVISKNEHLKRVGPLLK